MLCTYSTIAVGNREVVSVALSTRRSLGLLSHSGNRVTSRHETSTLVNAAEYDTLSPSGRTSNRQELTNEVPPELPPRSLGLLSVGFGPLTPNLDKFLVQSRKSTRGRRCISQERSLTGLAGWLSSCTRSAGVFPLSARCGRSSLYSVSHLFNFRTRSLLCLKCRPR